MLDLLLELFAEEIVVDELDLRLELLLFTELERLFDDVVDEVELLADELAAKELAADDVGIGLGPVPTALEALLMTDAVEDIVEELTLLLTALPFESELFATEFVAFEATALDIFAAVLDESPAEDETTEFELTAGLLLLFPPFPPPPPPQPVSDTAVINAP